MSLLFVRVSANLITEFIDSSILSDTTLILVKSPILLKFHP